MSERPRPVVVWGTGPNSGKTHTCVGIARSLVRRGVPTIPFKAVTVVAPEAPVPIPFHLAATRMSWHHAMTPVVVRYGGTTGAVEVRGRHVCDVELSGPDTVDLARLAPAHRAELVAAVDDALAELTAADAGVLLVEGAGSPVDAETDLANLHVLRRLVDGPGPAPFVLFSNYSWPGGVPAALIGTHALVPADLRPYLSGYVLSNPMPGAPVTRWTDEIGTRTGMRLLGVLPTLESYEERRATGTLDGLADLWGDALSSAVDLDRLLGEHRDLLSS
jgi:adenosylcobyric acid synthase